MQILCRLAICAGLLLAIYILAKIKVPTWTCPAWWMFYFLPKLIFCNKWEDLDRERVPLFWSILISFAAFVGYIVFGAGIYQASVIICDWIHPIGLGH